MSKQRVRSVEDEELAQGVPLVSESDISALTDDDDSKTNKTSYGLRSVCYAATISLILSLACFGLATTFGRREDERPIQLFEKDAAQAAAQHSSLTQTIEYKSRPYLASFLDKDLFFDGTSDNGEAPAKGTRYHIKFFEKADFTSTSLLFFSSTTNVGAFDSINEDGNILLTHGSYCKKAAKESSGIIKITKGDEMHLVNVVETEPCVYEYSVTTPFYDPVTVAVPPPANPDGEDSNGTASPDEGTTNIANKSTKKKYVESMSTSEGGKCPDGFYKDHKGRCMKKLKKKDAAKKNKNKSKK